MTTRMPAIFLGHGNPMNTLANNSFTRAWRALAQALPRPRAVLCISAHWFVPETAVTAMPAPRTIHDFAGFPEELFRVQYPAAGDPALAARVQDLLAPTPVRADEDWGLDHGAWSLLVHLFPKADVPVVQLSIDSRQPAAFHFEIGQRLAALRDEEVLILGSGNVVHNLRAYNWGDPNAAAYPWAADFESRAKTALLAGDAEVLIDYKRNLGSGAALAVPTPEHYLPLLYVLGARQADEGISFPVEGAEGGSISMLGVRMG